jgi:hypothetical protein
MSVHLRFGFEPKVRQRPGGGAVMQLLGLGSTALRILKYGKILLKLSLGRNNYGLIKNCSTNCG